MYIFNEKMMEQKKNSLLQLGLSLSDDILFFISSRVRTWLNATFGPFILKSPDELQHEWRGYLNDLCVLHCLRHGAFPSSWVLQKQDTEWYDARQPIDGRVWL